MEKPGGYIDLRTLIKQKGVLSEDYARVVTRHLLEAIQYCHSQGVLHRDIKGTNILVHHITGEIKLIDFGCAGHFSTNEYSMCKGKNKR